MRDGSFRNPQSAIRNQSDPPAPAGGTDLVSLKFAQCKTHFILLNGDKRTVIQYASNPDVGS